MNSKKNGYQGLKQQLDDIIGKLQDEDLDIDEAIKLNEQGQKVVAELEKYLAKTKHHFEEIKPSR